MPFGVIGRTGPAIRQVVRFGDRSTGRGIFGANLGPAIVTNGNFTLYVCDSAATRPSSQISLGGLVRIVKCLYTARLRSVSQDTGFRLGCQS